MRMIISKSEAMVPNQKKVECFLQVREEILPQVEEFSYLGVLAKMSSRHRVAGLSLRNRVRTSVISEELGVFALRGAR